MLVELHLRSVEAVNDHGRLIRRAHGDAAHSADVGQGQDVGNRGWVEPDLTKVREISDKG
jgi:hypothetical protein